MLVYQGTKETFMNQVIDGVIADNIRDLVRRKLNRNTSQAEYRSWNNSMHFMYLVMQTKEIPNDSDVSIEYRIPNTNKRVDFIVSGEDENKQETAVIIELKQWDHMEKVEDKDAVVLTELHRNAHAETVHPSYQAWSYAKTIEDFNEEVRNREVILKPCAFLHNYHLQSPDDLVASCYQPYISRAPIFTSTDTRKLGAFIAKYVHSANPEVMYHIENGRILPSKSLQDNIASMLKGNPEFTLIDDQKVIFEKALELVQKKTPKKKVYIIHGGPGTGKTVVAINLLAKILNIPMNVMYVSRNAAPRNVYKEKLTQGKFKLVTIKELFKGSGSFVNAKDNEFDCLLVDEAHRLTAKSGMFSNLGENQVKECIHAARTTIFFVDDEQIVTLKDIGSTKEIKKWCKYYDAEVVEDTMISQFRCSGSDSYLSWIDNVLEINTEASDEFDHDYDIRVFDTPEEVKQIILKKNKINNKARMVAGYCWDWKKDKRGDTNYHDIQIGDFGMSWNLDKNSPWAIDEKSVNEIGCIHTCQGLEFDYVGVIIGDDMRYDQGIVTDFTKRSSMDQTIRGIKKMYKQDPENTLKKADTIIKNTYRTLMTRGQKGCYIYCTDHKLNEYLKERLKDHNKRMEKK